MENAILSVLDWINELVMSIGGDSNVLFGSFGSFLPGLYSYSYSVMRSVIMPISYVVLSLFFLLELHKASLQLEGAGMGNAASISMIFKVLIKMAICKVVVDETPNILSAIYNLTKDITSQVNSLNSSSSIANGLDMDMLAAQVSGIEFIKGIIPLLIAFITFLVVWIATIIANVIIITRFIELYIYLAISPIPIATLPHDEMSQIGKNFLKSFTAVCLQGILIFLVLSFFPVIFNSSFISAGGGAMSTGDIYKSMFGVLGYSIVLIIALFSTGKWAKSICGAM